MTAIASPVRDQYEAFPYPPRDPGRELEQLHTTLIGQLALANHALAGGRWAIGPGFHVLDAGCGTGDNAIFLAEQLRGTGATVTGVDLSEHSLAIAAARARARGLEIDFHHARIEETPALGLGPFDYIVSAGVLHHLPDPAVGLAALRSLLTPGGGMGLMVYGQYGRTAIYQLQELLRIIAPPSLPAEARIAIARRTVAELRNEHWAAFGRDTFAGEIELHGDAGLYDVLLHSTDRAYTVPQIHEWLASGGMRLARFIMPALYEPSLYSASLDTSGMDVAARQAAAELLHGRMQKHSFFAAKAETPAVDAPPWHDLGAIPAWLRFDHDGLIRRQLAERPELHLVYEGFELRLTLDPFRRALLRSIDGQRTLGEILVEMAGRYPKTTVEERVRKWNEAYAALEQFNLLGMRAGGRTGCP
ncbi:MAG: methyltransferase domain-containing protein [Dehalococcoidia bacterium]